MWMDFFVLGKMMRYVMWNKSGFNRRHRRKTLPPFVQLHWCGKETTWLEANLRSESITLLHNSPVGGGRCSWRRQSSHISLNPLWVNWVHVRGHWELVWDQISGKKEDVFEVCAKILVRLLLEHELFFPFFCTFSVCLVLTLNFPI